MFSRAKNHEQTAGEKAGRAGNQLSILAPDLTVVGNIVSKGDIQIDGRLEGDVRSAKLTIGEAAVINGTVRGDKIRVAGTINGEIIARVVVLTSTAKVTGDIRHDSLSIEAGAFVQGLCKRVEPEKLNLDGAPKHVAASPAAPVAGNSGQVVGNRNSGSA